MNLKNGKTLTDEEKELIDKNLTKGEQKQLEKMVDKLTAIYILTGQSTGERGNLYREWMMDSERFMGFLVSHSITLIALTKWLKWLTMILIGLTLVHIFMILNDTYKWF